MDSCVTDTVSTDDCDAVEDLVMSDIPIDNPDVGASLPASEEMRASFSSSSRNLTTPKDSRRKYMWLGLGVVVLLALIVGLSVGLTKPSEQESQAQAPVPRKAQFDDVVNYLDDAGVSTVDDMRNPSKPQSKAIVWLTELDDRNLPVPPHPVTSDAGYHYVSRYVLSLLWFALGGEQWEFQADWLSGKDHCNWRTDLIAATTTGMQVAVQFGSLCDAVTAKVAGIRLDLNNLTGTIPTELGYLSSLQIITMQGNPLRGGFPESICDLENLAALDLSRDELIGTLPPCISNMTALQVLILSNNDFGGTVPSLVKLTDMRILALDNNAKLAGNLTATFHNMTRLTSLYLDDTSLSGHIDHNFLKTSLNLSQVDLSNCQFHGGLPSHLLELPLLQVLDLHGNRFRGTLPETIKNNTMLKFLAIHENDFNGTIPESIVNLQNLFHLDLSNNRFTGAMPRHFGNMTNLQRLYLSQNPFSRGTIPSEFHQLTALRELSLKNTSRSFTIPTFIGNLTRLELLDLDANDFNGTIPTELGDLTQLQFLLLNRNERLDGEIPQSFQNLSSLRVAFLDRTELNGTLEGLCNLPNFNEAEGDADGNEIISADCRQPNPEVECSCCSICCSDDDESTCNVNGEVPSINPEWQYGYDRFEFDFGGTANFQDRAYINDGWP